MPLVPGNKLGPYQLETPLGAGGMGEVYRARDTRLDRGVAIKILPAHLSSNPDLKQRFEREARAISSINHPHICALYDVGHQDGVDFLVMELIEGENLAERLTRGPLPSEQVVKVAAEIADALDKAHRHGIVHRDVKPSNIMLTKSGAKLLDFGLAKPSALPAAAGSGAIPAFSAARTLTTPASPLTSAGSVLGTVQYMAPEQIEGKEADARSDIFAFGAVLYEMVTGKRAFEGKSQISVVSAILEREPQPISVLQPTSPPALRQVVETCLAKDPDERFQTAHDLTLQLRWIAEGPATARPAERPVARRKLVLAGSAAAALVVVAAVFGYLAGRSGQSAQPLRALIDPPEKQAFDVTGDYGGVPVLAPAGDKIAFTAHGPNSPKALWVRSLDSFVAQRLDGTEGAAHPFWSLDGRYLGFFSNGKLNKIAATGGPVVSLAPAINPRGGTWGSDDVILFAPDFQGVIHRVSANGGPVTQVTKLDPRHTTHRWPLFLPDGQHFLYLATNHNGGRPEDNGAFYASLDGRENHMVVATDGGAQVAAGYLLYHSGTALMAQRFDAGSGKISGEAMAVVDRVRHDSGVWRTLFTVSQNGLLAYQPGTAEAAGTRLVWHDRTGKQLGQAGERGSYIDPRLSPDGKRVAVGDGDPVREIWVLDLERGTKTRLTFDQTVKLEPAWSPDGKTILYSAALASSGGNRTNIRAKPSNGAGAEQTLVGEDPVLGYTRAEWSPDGRSVAYIKSRVAGNAIYVQALGGDSKPLVAVAATSPQTTLFSFRISPNGRWIAYSSNESGRPQIYLAPFPRGDGKWQVSTGGGGDSPAWRGDGKELFYWSNADELYACPVSENENEPQVGTPAQLFRANAAAIGSPYDASRDGQRFLVNLAEEEAAAPLHLVVNWMAELKRK